MNDVNVIPHEGHGHHHEHLMIIVNGREKIVMSKGCRLPRSSSSPA